jgi:hypothetical protein
MIKKDIENLIAKYPDEFFPDSGFKLSGRQMKLGRCYADMIFVDKHKRKIIVEIIHGVLSQDASGQEVENYEMLKSERPEDFVELILCANNIPTESKKSLESIGIKCKELRINFIHQIAEKVGYNFINAQQQTEGEEKLPDSENIWIFQASTKIYDIVGALDDDEIGNLMHWEVNQHKNEIFEGHIGIIWKSGIEAGIYAIAEIISNPKMLKETPTEKKWRINDSDNGEDRLRVKLNINKKWLKFPLTRETIKNTEGLEDMSILKQPWAGTNFPVTPDEWFIIKHMIEKR